MNFTVIAVARIFSGGGALFLTKNLMTFYSSPSFAWSYPLYMPPTTFLSHLRGCTSPNSPHFCLISNKNCLQNIFSVALGGGAPAPPGYAYVYSWSPLVEINLKSLLTCLLIVSQFMLSYTANAKFLATLVLYRDELKGLGLESIFLRTRTRVLF